MLYNILIGTNFKLRLKIIMSSKLRKNKRSEVKTDR